MMGLIRILMRRKKIIKSLNCPSCGGWLYDMELVSLSPIENETYLRCGECGLCMTAYLKCLICGEDFTEIGCSNPNCQSIDSVLELTS